MGLGKRTRCRTGDLSPLSPFYRPVTAPVTAYAIEITMPFENLSPVLSDALTARGYEALTPVQTQVTESEAKGRDLLVSAQTGSGKTVAFGLAMADELIEGDRLPFATSPLALIREIREWFDGPLALSGAIGHGASVLAAQAMGADFGYIGSAFIATAEANAVDGYKDNIVEGVAADIVYSDLFTGVHGNYLRQSIERAGMDPDNLPKGDISTMNFGSGGNTEAKAWKDIWGSGQGIGAVKSVLSVEDFVARMESEYRAAKESLDARYHKGW